MEFISWNESLSVGVGKFDDEHKNLVNFINKLNNALTVGSTKKTIEEILTGLIKYTAIHFKHEEDYMVLYDYPDYEDHRKEHRELTSQVADFFERYQSGKTTFSLELMNFLRDWLTGHIQKVDRAYRDYFNGKGVN